MPSAPRQLIIEANKALLANSSYITQENKAIRIQLTPAHVVDERVGDRVFLEGNQAVEARKVSSGLHQSTLLFLANLIKAKIIAL